VVIIHKVCVLGAKGHLLVLKREVFVSLLATVTSNPNQMKHNFKTALILDILKFKF